MSKATISDQIIEGFVSDVAPRPLVKTVGPYRALSAQPLHLVSGQLESHARKGDTDGVRVALELLEREAARFLERVPALVVDMSDQQRRVMDVG